MRNQWFGAFVVASLLVLSPVRAERAEGAFEASALVALWGDLTIQGGKGALYQRADDEGAFEATAPHLTVTQVTIRANETSEERTERSYEFTSATVRLESGAYAQISKPETGETGADAAGIDWSLRFDDPRVPPKDVDPKDENAPRPTALLGPGSFVPAQADPQPEARGPLPPTAPSQTQQEETVPIADPDSFSLLPSVAGRLEGYLSLLLTSGSISVRGSEGERTFATDFHEETTVRGGVDVPVVGNVGGTEERTYVWNLTLVQALDSAGVVPPNREEGEMRTAYVGTELLVAVEGTAFFSDATGTIRIGGEERRMDRQDLVLGGAFDLLPGEWKWGRDGASSAPEPKGDPSGPKTYEFTAEAPRADFALSGDVTYLRVEERPGEDFVPLVVAGAGAAGLAGLLVLVPAAKFAASKAFFLPLYTRLRKPEVLEQDRRSELLKAIREDPGASASDLGVRLHIGWGNLVYHLSVLERERVISSVREGRHRRFFPAGETDRAMRMPLALLRNTQAARVLTIIRSEPGAPQKRVSRALGLSPSTVHWHAERLADAGLVWRRKRGREIEYHPTDLLEELDSDRDGFAG